MSKSTSIKVIHGALDETPQGEIILRGIINADNLHLIQVDDYQREVLPLTTITEIMKALETGTVPDIELAMRGGRCIDREESYYLQDDVYVVDGLQRVTAGLELLKKGLIPRIGAVIHFNTTRDWEKERFRILNLCRTKLNSNVVVRNLKDGNEAVDLLYRLSLDKNFVLGGRVCWKQRMQRDELLTAVTFLKVVARLHGHVVTGTRNSNLEQIADALVRLIEIAGPNVFRDNVKAFFDLVDQAWGVKRIAFKEGASYIRSSFLMCLASLLSDHYDFWGRGQGNGNSEHRLFIEKTILNKFHLFPVSDPQVVTLAGSSGKSRDMLYMLMLQHINSGKRTRRLKGRYAEVSTPPTQDDDSESGDE